MGKVPGSFSQKSSLELQQKPCCANQMHTHKTILNTGCRLASFWQETQVTGTRRWEWENLSNKITAFNKALEAISLTALNTWKCDRFYKEIRRHLRHHSHHSKVKGLHHLQTYQVFKFFYREVHGLHTDTQEQHNSHGGTFGVHIASSFLLSLNH